jgi:DNA polymerase III gamma/tau subunit
MSLYLKHRPDTFDKVIGNEQVVESITNILKKKNHPHTYLFTGGTGCGKTTIARIIANELGAKGMDVKEINSSDFRGIDTIRELIKQSQYKPMESPCRVWIMDEVHKLTSDAQNAMLKILEDTPSHVYFILCTTEPEKLITTIKGRCSIFQMKTLDDKQMYRLLRKTVKAEEDTLEQEIYDQIIQDSLGHPRNALQILEQVLNVEPANRLEIAKQKAIEYSKSIELCRELIKKGSWKSIAEILKGLKGNEEPESIRRAVLGYCSSALLNGENDQIAVVMECFKDPFYDTGYPGLVFACYSAVA